MDRQSAADEDFIQSLTDHQSDLRAYILAAVGDHTAALDVLQQTNVVLWRKASEFRPGEPFLPWAFAIARYEILAHIRGLQRERVVFTPEVAELMCETGAKKTKEDLSDRRIALQSCMGAMNRESRSLLEYRYTLGLTIQQMAEKTGRTNRSISSAMTRIRQALGECVRRRLARVRY